MCLQIKVPEKPTILGFARGMVQRVVTGFLPRRKRMDSSAERLGFMADEMNMEGGFCRVL